MAHFYRRATEKGGEMHQKKIKPLGKVCLLSVPSDKDNTLASKYMQFTHSR